LALRSESENLANQALPGFPLGICTLFHKEISAFGKTKSQRLAKPFWGYLAPLNGLRARYCTAQIL
jgi:hypothetical protein